MVRTAAYGKLGVGFDSSSTVTYQLRRNSANKPPSTESCNGPSVSSKNVLWRSDPPAASAATTASYMAGGGSRDISSRDRDVVDWMMAVNKSSSNHHHSHNTSHPSSSSSPSSGPSSSSSNGHGSSSGSTNGNHSSSNYNHAGTGGFHLNHHRHPDQQQQQQQQQQQHGRGGYGGGAGGGAVYGGGGGVPGFAAGFGGLFKIKPVVANDTRELRTSATMPRGAGTTTTSSSSSPSSPNGKGEGLSPRRGGGNAATSSAAREERRGEQSKATGNKYDTQNSRFSLPSQSSYTEVTAANGSVQRKRGETNRGDNGDKRMGGEAEGGDSVKAHNELSGGSSVRAPPAASVAVVIPTTTVGDWSAGKKGFDLVGDMTYYSRPSRGTSTSSSPSSPTSPFSPFSNSSISSCSSSSPSQQALPHHRLPNFPYDWSNTRGGGGAYENRLCEDFERGLYGLSSSSAASYWPTASYGQEPSRSSGGGGGASFGGFSEYERETDSSNSFMSVCDLCAKRLGQNADIYIYRGEKAFCSAECRQQVIQADQALAAAASNTCGSAPAAVGRRAGRVGF